MQKHTVASGETLYRISKNYGVTVAALKAANNKADNTISVGQILHIPTQKEAAQSVTAQAALPAPKGEMGYATHQVKAGETLYRIGKSYGVTAIDIMAANDFDKPQDLMAGMKIKVPQLVTAGTSPKQATQQVAQVARINQTLAQAKGMVWPAQGRIISQYGQQGPGLSRCIRRRRHRLHWHGAIRPRGSAQPQHDLCGHEQRLLRVDKRTGLRHGRQRLSQQKRCAQSF